MYNGPVIGNVTMDAMTQIYHGPQRSASSWRTSTAIVIVDSAQAAITPPASQPCRVTAHAAAVTSVIAMAIVATAVAIPGAGSILYP